MISKDTKATINEATTITSNNEQQDSSYKIQPVYAPLITYGAIAIGMVAVVVTIAVMTEDHLQDITKNVATTQLETKQEANAQELSVAITTSTDDVQVSNKTDAVDIINSNLKESSSEIDVVSLSTKEPEAINAAPATQKNEAILISKTEQTPIQPTYRSIREQQGEQQLHRLKMNHDRQISHLKQIYSSDNDYLDKNIQRLEKIYQRQVATIKKFQNLRNL